MCTATTTGAPQRPRKPQVNSWAWEEGRRTRRGWADPGRRGEDAQGLGASGKEGRRTRRGRADRGRTGRGGVGPTGREGAESGEHVGPVPSSSAVGRTTMSCGARQAAVGGSSCLPPCASRRWSCGLFVLATVRFATLELRALRACHRALRDAGAAGSRACHRALRGTPASGAGRAGHRSPRGIWGLRARGSCHRATGPLPAARGAGRSLRARVAPAATALSRPLPQRLPSRITRATSAGSSFIGQWPQPGRRTRRARGMICLARTP